MPCGQSSRICSVLRAKGRTYVVGEVAVCTPLIDRRTARRLVQVVDVLSVLALLLLDPSKRLDVELLASSADVHASALGERPLNLELGRVHPEEDPHVKVDRERDEWDNVSAITGCDVVARVEEQSEGNLVRVVGFGRDTSVVGEAGGSHQRRRKVRVLRKRAKAGGDWTHHFSG